MANLNSKKQKNCALMKKKKFGRMTDEPKAYSDRKTCFNSSFYLNRWNEELSDFHVRPGPCSMNEVYFPQAENVSLGLGSCYYINHNGKSRYHEVKISTPFPKLIWHIS